MFGGKGTLLLIAMILVLTSCQPSESPGKRQQEAEHIAQEFAARMSKGDFTQAYDLFVPSERELRSKADFTTYARAKDETFNLYYDHVFLSNASEAFAYYTGQSGIVEAKIDPIPMYYIEGEGWRVDAFALYFISSCAESCIAEELCESATCGESTGFLCQREPVSECSCSSSSECPQDREFCLEGFCSSTECVSNDHCKSYKKNAAEAVRKYSSDLLEKYDAYDLEKFIQNMGEVCFEGSCVQCTENKDCSGSTPYCDVESHLCMECVTSSQCPNETPSCLKSETYSGKPLNYCVECITKANCDEGLCENNYCVECLEDVDCPTGKYCQRSSSTCIPFGRMS